MGVNTIASLPNGVTVRNVEDALTRITGAKVEMTTTSIPVMLDVNVWADGKSHHATYHFEGGHDFKTKTLHCGSSNTFWAAVCVKLVECLGGEVDVNDCDSSDVDYAKVRRYPTFGHDVTIKELDDWYDRLKERIEALTPITVADRKPWLGKVARRDLNLAPIAN